MMQDKRKRKVKKGSYSVLQREARRQERLKWLFAVAKSDPEVTDLSENKSRKRVIIDLACKTVMLLQRHNLIQQKIIDLKKETTAFMFAVMSNPANKHLLTATQFLEGSSNHCKTIHPKMSPALDSPEINIKMEAEI